VIVWRFLWLEFRNSFVPSKPNSQRIEMLKLPILFWIPSEQSSFCSTLLTIWVFCLSSCPILCWIVDSVLLTLIDWFCMNSMPLKTTQSLYVLTSCHEQHQCSSCVKLWGVKILLLFCVGYTNCIWWYTFIHFRTNPKKYLFLSSCLLGQTWMYSHTIQFFLHTNAEYSLCYMFYWHLNFLTGTNESFPQAKSRE
jgi:hypothetical protein